MHKSTLILLLPLALAVAACSQGGNGAASSNPAAASSAQAPVPNSVTGVVIVKAGMNGDYKPSTDARLELKLTDVSQAPSLPLAEKTIQPIGKLPVSFELDFDRSQLSSSDVIVLVAEIIDGKRHYTMPLQMPVLNHGPSENIQVELVPNATPGEELLDQFEAFQRQLGGMKASNGSSRGEKGSRAWQVFTKNGHVQFITDIRDNFETKARTKTEFAYKDGEPWVVVRKHLANANAEPSVIERAGWDATDNVILNERVANGEVEPLTSEALAQLHEDAVSEFKRLSK